jgi:hypothetical protein
MMKSALGFCLTLLAGGSAGAMSSVDPMSMHCSVNNAGKLPAGLTADGICAVIRGITAPALVSSGRLSIEVTVLSNSSIKAAATLDGKPRPEQRVATSDRSLNANAIEMLARAIAAEIARPTDRGA